MTYVYGEPCMMLSSITRTPYVCINNMTCVASRRWAGTAISGTGLVVSTRKLAISVKIPEGTSDYIECI